jgi:steroid 5-alpha reductase family enzyme
MTPAWAVFGTNLAAAMALMFCVWLLSLAKKDVSIVDIFWGLGFVVIA